MSNFPIFPIGTYHNVKNLPLGTAQLCLSHIVRSSQMASVWILAQSKIKRQQKKFEKKRKNIKKVLDKIYEIWHHF